MMAVAKTKLFIAMTVEHQYPGEEGCELPLRTKNVVPAGKQFCTESGQTAPAGMLSFTTDAFRSINQRGAD